MVARNLPLAVFFDTSDANWTADLRADPGELAQQLAKCWSELEPELIELERFSVSGDAREVFHEKLKQAVFDAVA